VTAEMFAALVEQVGSSSIRPVTHDRVSFSAVSSEFLPPPPMTDAAMCSHVMHCHKKRLISLYLLCRRGKVSFDYYEFRLPRFHCALADGVSRSKPHFI
jgi:hypothetical protein